VVDKGLKLSLVACLHSILQWCRGWLQGEMFVLGYITLQRTELECNIAMGMVKVFLTAGD
jgi:hypothetical protein